MKRAWEPPTADVIGGDSRTDADFPPAKRLQQEIGGRESSGFRSASGKSVILSEEARNKAKALLNAGADFAVHALPLESSTLHSSSTINSAHTGVTAPMGYGAAPRAASSLLQRASGKSVTISDEARSRALQVLGQDRDEKIPQASNGSVTTLPKSDGFKRASGASVAISDAARLRVPEILGTTNRPSEQVTPISVVPSASVSQGGGGGGFKRASGAAVTISDAARQRASEILSAANRSGEQEAVSSVLPVATMPQGGGGGFKRASGAAVTISDAARQRASEILSAVSRTVEQEASVLPVATVPHQGGGGGGFKRASGAAVAISDAARQRASEILSGASGAGERQMTSTAPSVAVSQGRTGGFQRTSGAAVSISDEARLRASEVLAATGRSGAEVVSSAVVVSQGGGGGGGGGGFQRASGKGVTIPEEARVRAHQLLTGGSSLSTSVATSSATSLATIRPANAPSIAAPLPSPAVLPPPTSQTPKRALDQQFALVDDSSGAATSVEPVSHHARTLYSMAKSELSFATTREAMLTESPDWVSLDVPVPQSLSSTTAATAAGTATVLTPVISWRDIPSLQRRYLLLQRINSSNVLDMLHEIDPSLAAINTLTRETWRPSAASSSASSSSLSNAAYYARELDTLDKGRWKQKQLQWIAWTFVGYERRHPDRYLGKLLVYDTIVECLLHRYHRYQRNIARTSASLDSLSVTTSSNTTPNNNSGSNTKRNALLKSKHVSSLQRFQEICDWSWPLCLTVSIQKSFVWNKGSSGGGGGENPAAMAKPAVIAYPQRKNASSSSSPWHADPRAAVQEEWQIEVTDGWWWVRAIFDTPLRQLIRENKLTDGMKVVVFAGKFNPEDTSLVSITFHNMRRAHVTAPLGPVPKASLTRGLAFPAIRPDGGSIFSLQFVLLAVVHQVGIASTKGNDSSASSSSRPGGGNHVHCRVTVNENEAEKFMERLQDTWMAIQDRQWHEAIDKGELDDEDIAYYRKTGSFGGGGGRGEDSLLAEVQLTQFTSLLVRDTTSKQTAWIVLSQGGGSGSGSGSGSGGSGGGGGHGGSGGEGLHSDHSDGWVVGARYCMTNAMPSKKLVVGGGSGVGGGGGGSQAPYQLYQSRASTFQVLGATRPQDADALSVPSLMVMSNRKAVVKDTVVVVARDAIIERDQFPIEWLFDRFDAVASRSTAPSPFPKATSPRVDGHTATAVTASSLSPLSSSSTTTTSLIPLRSRMSSIGTFVSMTVTIVDVTNSLTGERLFGEPSSSSSSTLSTSSASSSATRSRPTTPSAQSIASLLEEASLHLLCVDVYGTVVNLHGVWFTSQLRSLPWLVPRECRVRIDFALLTAMDTRHGILRLEKTEHTIVSVRAEPKAARTPIRRVSFSAPKPTPTWASKASQWKGIEETLRIQALQQSAEVYCSQWISRHEESTADLASTDVVEQPIYLTCAVIPLRNVEMVHPVPLSKDDIRSTALGEDLWTLYRPFVVDIMMDYDVFMETMNTTTSTMDGGGDHRRSLPWTPVAQETDLLPTHMAIKALFICPNDLSADDESSKKLLADSVAILQPTGSNVSSSDSMLLWDVLVHTVVDKNDVVTSSSSLSSTAFHVVVKQWHSA